MARLAAILSLSVLLASLPSALAGPACARRHFKQADCIARCKSKWGWTGAMMNTDPWGSVVQKTDTNTNWDTAIASACGFASSASASADVSGPTIAPAANAIPVPSAGSNTVTASASATASPASSSTLPASIANFFSSASAARASATSSKAQGSGTPSARIQAVSTSSKPKSSSPAAAANLVPTNTPVTTTRAARPSPVAPTTTSPKAEPTTTKAAAATTTAASSNSNNGGSSGTSQADIQAYLAGHNTVRAQHGASALTWNDNLASKAQEWANKCVFQHSGGQLGAFGENLAAGTGPSYDIAAGIKSWTDEVSEYNPSNPVASHFTQVVWKGTSEVGCAVANCNGIFDPKFGVAKFFVCEYSKQGNIIGQFAQNVQA